MVKKKGTSHNIISLLWTEIVQFTIDWDQLSTMKLGNDTRVTMVGMHKGMKVQFVSFSTMVEAYVGCMSDVAAEVWLSDL